MRQVYFDGFTKRRRATKSAYIQRYEYISRLNNHLKSDVNGLSALCTAALITSIIQKRDDDDG